MIVAGNNENAQVEKEMKDVMNNETRRKKYMTDKFVSKLKCFKMKKTRPTEIPKRISITRKIKQPATRTQVIAKNMHGMKIKSKITNSN
jgi:hypothetical protein